MELKEKLDDAINGSDEFYREDGLGLLIAHKYGEACFKLFCYDMSCGCQQTNSCDLQEGETIKTLYPDAAEITKEQFSSLFESCHNEFYKDHESE